MLQEPKGHNLSKTENFSSLVSSYSPNDYLESCALEKDQEEHYFHVNTGFLNFDKNLHGGLSRGLHVLGAISGLGKTTISIQIAEQIAKSGQDVLFFSLEMSRCELRNKCLKRNLFDLFGIDAFAGNKAKEDSFQIYCFASAMEKYSLAAKHLYIFEDEYKNQPISANLIKEISKKHKEITGNTPVVFVDYLQVLSPICNRTTDKQNVDDSVRILRKISRELNTVVFAISSFNRDNYKEPVNISSFKETGSIEYSADYLYGMQIRGMDYEVGEKEQTRLSRIRKLEQDVILKTQNDQPIETELKCLKNRFGCQFSIVFDMMPRFSHFSESKQN